MQHRALVNYEWDVPDTSPLANDRGTITVSLDYGRLRGITDDTEIARKVIAVKRTGSVGNWLFVVINSIEVDPVIDMRTPDLVREFADLKAWFAVNETTGRTPEGNAKHVRLGKVVDELRARGGLD